MADEGQQGHRIWNALMIRAFVEAARAFGRPDYRAAAENAGRYLAATLVRDGRVSRSSLDGRVSGPGMLEDHAAVALAFLELYGLTFDTSWLRLSRTITERTIERFHDTGSETWYDTAVDHERLIVRPREVTDNATPSGTSLTAELLLAWAELDDIHEWRSMAERVVSSVGEAIAQYPQALGHLAGVADTIVNGSSQVAIVGAVDHPGLRELAGRLGAIFTPALTLAGGDPLTEGQPALIRDRSAIGGIPTAYVCRGFTCHLPTSDPAEFERQVKHLVGDGAITTAQHDG
jgi:uncharacterized protein YyaL (SSP411 family)